MIPKTNNETSSQTEGRIAPPLRPDDLSNLSHRYGSIGIQAVAAAARYADVRSKPDTALRIDLRFVESAG
jgi:hypothetical protein